MEHKKFLLKQFLSWEKLIKKIEKIWLSPVGDAVSQIGKKRTYS